MLRTSTHASRRKHIEREGRVEGRVTRVGPYLEGGAQLIGHGWSFWLGMNGGQVAVQVARGQECQQLRQALAAHSQQSSAQAESVRQCVEQLPKLLHLLRQRGTSPRRLAEKG